MIRRVIPAVTSIMALKSTALPLCVIKIPTEASHPQFISDDTSCTASSVAARTTTTVVAFLALTR
jgi:hypothetical protein